MTTSILGLISQRNILTKEADELESRIHKLESEAAVFSWTSLEPLEHNSDCHRWLSRYTSLDYSTQMAQIVAKNPREYGLSNKNLEDFLTDVFNYRIGKSVGLPIGDIPRIGSCEIPRNVTEEFLSNPSKYLPDILNIIKPEKSSSLLELVTKKSRYKELSFRVIKSLFIENDMYSNSYRLIDAMSQQSATYQEELANPGNYRIVLTDENLFTVEKFPPFWAVYLFVGAGVGMETVELLKGYMKINYSPLYLTEELEQEEEVLSSEEEDSLEEDEEEDFSEEEEPL